MSERKAINKYYPPDYDPSKTIRRKKKPPSSQPQTIKIRMMAPYSMRCTRCNEYIAERRSFNARKEVTDERYLNIKIIRFYITCPGCNQTISFKTNPAEAGYTPEMGAVRNFERKEEEKKKKRDKETDEELMRRLEGEARQDEAFRDMVKKRKVNPFWNAADGATGAGAAGGGDVVEKFERRLVESKRERDVLDELERIHGVVEQVRERGGEELVDLVRRKIELEEEIEAGREQAGFDRDGDGDKVESEEKKVENEQVGGDDDNEKEKPAGAPKMPKIPTKITIKKKVNSAIANKFNYSSDSE
ncbi:uncharacterized protein LODBEIA_P21530 [Lodderomyces beijingensis]|uniref:Splicing factor YJU2 n=1 Tax=Lodderomyces beijingensis TaxID=1775926 RepID=A0ABP0ZIE0_9ASCO